MSKEINVLVACGSGVVTSTIVQEAVRQIAARAGVKAKILKSTITEIPVIINDVDIVLTTSGYRQPLDKLCINAFPLISGMDKAETERKLEELFKQLAE